MTSAGLRKDSSGVAKLSDEDIRRIELGYTSVHTPNNPLIQRLEGTFFEINAFMNGAPPQGGSLSQRAVYLQTGLKVAAKNWLLGTGTGDVNQAMLNQYAEDRSSLEPDFQRRPHNQYLTFLITFGVAGLIYFVWLNGFAMVLALRSNNFMAIGFTMLAALSFLAEDTLETQIGVSFFAFFYAFLLLPSDEQNAGNVFRFNER
jgi:O-antigen ligase